MLTYYIKMFKVIDRQSVVLHHDLNASSSWYEDLGLYFHPDLVKVQEVLYGGDAAANVNVYGITTSFLRNKNSLLCAFRGVGDLSNPNTHIDIDETTDLMNGSIKFEAVTLTNTLGANLADGVVCVTLEFLKHDKTRKENTQYYSHKEKGKKGGAYFDDPSVNVHTSRVLPMPEPVPTIFVQPPVGAGNSLKGALKKKSPNTQSNSNQGIKDKIKDKMSDKMLEDYMANSNAEGTLYEEQQAQLPEHERDDFGESGKLF